MKIIIVLAHPSPKSFNAALAEAAVKTLSMLEHEVYYHDLYREGFNPVIEAAEISNKEKDRLPDDLVLYHRELMAADGLIVIHPNWWGQPPAILTGWIDRIFRPGVAYHFLTGDSGGGIPAGLLKIRTALVFNTSDTASDREETVFGDPLQRIWEDCILRFCGVPNIYRKTFPIIVNSSPAQRCEWLEEVRETVRYYFPKESDSNDSSLC